jgi:hypothetical protein
VLIHLNISELPKKYYIPRWRPKDKKAMRAKQFNIPVDLTTTNRHLQYGVLSRRLSNIASEGSLTNQKYLFLSEKAKEIEDRLDEMTLEDELAYGNNKQISHHKNTVLTEPHEDGYADFRQNLDVAPSKGTTESSKRQKTFMEELFSKNSITCNHCGSDEHSIATCRFLHIDKSVFAKKITNKKKSSGVKKAKEHTEPKKSQRTTKNNRQQPAPL